MNRVLTNSEEYINEDIEKEIVAEEKKIIFQKLQKMENKNIQVQLISDTSKVVELTSDANWILVLGENNQLITYF